MDSEHDLFLAGVRCVPVLYTNANTYTQKYKYVLIQIQIQTHGQWARFVSRWCQTCPCAIHTAPQYPHHLHCLHCLLHICSFFLWSFNFQILFFIGIHYVRRNHKSLHSWSISVMCVVWLVGVSVLGVPRETQKPTSDPEISILPLEQSPKWEPTNFARLFICEKSASMLRSEGKYLTI